jgi:hypothetical protein
MGRNKGNRLWTTYEWGNEPNQIGNTEDITLDWRGGGEVLLGRRFCCGCWALEASFWTLDEFSGFASFTHANNVGTPLTVSGIEFGTDNAVAFFDNAEEHRLWRYNEFYNVELNLIRNQMFFTSCQGWNLDWSIGVRFFRFDENLIFGSLANGGTWGGNGGADEAYFNDRIVNNLIGFQFGVNADYYFGSNWRFFVSPQVGVYNNHMEHHFAAYLGDGTVASPTAASGVVGTYPVDSTDDAFSFLTQVDIGLDCRCTQNWSVRIGYRVVAVTGVGLSDNQIPPYIVDIPEIADIDRNGELILHGAFVGATYNY